MLEKVLVELLFSVKTASYPSPREYRLHKYVCVCVCARAHVCISDDIQCVGGLNDPPCPVLSTAPVGNQALFHTSLCSRRARLVADFSSTISHLSHRIWRTKWYRVPVHTKPPLGFFVVVVIFSRRRAPAISFYFKLNISPLSSPFYPNLLPPSAPFLFV